MLKLSATLSSKSLNDLLKQVGKYREKISGAPEKLVHTLTEQGVSIAKLNASYMNIYDSGELMNGIDSRYDGNTGKIVSEASHSAFCEFGTGVVGKGSQHPDPPPGWVYDVNEHGEDGWWYYNDQGEKRWTKGMPSRPYMYDTARMLRNMIEPAAKEVIK